MMERYEVIKKSHLQSYFIVRDDAQGVKSSKNKKNTRLHWSCDKSQISLFSYICVAYNFHPPPTFCCFCQASPALPSLLVSLPLPKIIPTFAGHCLSQQAPFFPRGFQYLQPDPSSVPWNLLYLSIVGTWKFEIARWKEEFMGSHDQTIRSREVYLDGRNDQNQDRGCSPSPPWLHFSLLLLLTPILCSLLHRLSSPTGWGRLSPVTSRIMSQAFAFKEQLTPSC